PSTAPNTVPSKSPSSTLFIAPPFSSRSCTTVPQNPLALAMHENEDQHPHCQVRCNQQDKESIPPVKAAQPVKNAFTVCRDCQTVKVSRDIERQLLDRAVAFWRGQRGRLRADRCQRLIKTEIASLGPCLGMAGKQKTEQRAERKNIAAGVELFNLAAGLFRRHIARCAHDCSVPGDHGNFRRVTGIGWLLRVFPDCCVRIGFASTV